MASGVFCLSNNGPKHQRLLAPFPRARIGEQQRTQNSDSFSGRSGGKCFSLGSGGPTERHSTSNRAHFRLPTGHQFLPYGQPSHFRHGETEPKRARDLSKVTQQASAEIRTQVSITSIKRPFPNSQLPFGAHCTALHCKAQGTGLPSAVRPPGGLFTGL